RRLWLAAFSLLGVASDGEALNIIVAASWRLHGLMFRDPTGGKNGQEGVGPGAVGAVGAVRGGVRVVAEVTIVFVLGCGRPAVSAPSPQPLARARGSERWGTDGRSG